MKSTILSLFLLLSTLVWSQPLDINTKNGFGASGFDLVSYFNAVPTIGLNAYKHDYNNVTYKFSSEENLILFKENPNKYLPQYGGYCAYAIGEKNIKMKVDPETFKIINDKLYLFYNFWFTNTSEAWDEEKDIQSKADYNWKTLQYKD